VDTLVFRVAGVFAGTSIDPHNTAAVKDLGFGEPGNAGIACVSKLSLALKKLAENVASYKAVVSKNRRLTRGKRFAPGDAVSCLVVKAPRGVKQQQARVVETAAAGGGGGSPTDGTPTDGGAPLALRTVDDGKLALKDLKNAGAGGPAWFTGVVEAVGVREPGWPSWKSVPYQVRITGFEAPVTVALDTDQWVKSLGFTRLEEERAAIMSTFNMADPPALPGAVVAA